MPHEQYRIQDLRVQFSDRVIASHARGPGFYLSKKERRKDKTIEKVKAFSRNGHRLNWEDIYKLAFQWDDHHKTCQQTWTEARFKEEKFRQCQAIFVIVLGILRLSRCCTQWQDTVSPMRLFPSTPPSILRGFSQFLTFDDRWKLCGEMVHQSVFHTVTRTGIQSPRTHTKAWQ